MNEKTTIPLFTALATLPVLIGGIVWLTAIDTKADRSLEKTATQQDILKEYGAEIKQMRSSLIRIETKLGTMPRNNKGED